MIALSRMWLDM